MGEKNSETETKFWIFCIENNNMGKGSKLRKKFSLNTSSFI